MRGAVTLVYEVRDLAELNELASRLDVGAAQVSCALEQELYAVAGVDIEAGESFGETVEAASEAEAVQLTCSGTKIPAHVSVVSPVPSG